jgi:hypothetical protein
MEDRRNKTAQKHKYLRRACNELVVMKECVFKPTLVRPCATTITPASLLKQICEGEIFGAVVCDIRVPDALRNHFAEMTPVFKNVSVSIDDVGAYMKDVCENLGEMKTNRRMLIGSYFGTQIMVASPLLKWYYTHGLDVTNITAFIEYEPVRCFQDFTEEISEARRKADHDQSGTAAGNTAKLIGKVTFFISKTFKRARYLIVFFYLQETRCTEKP